MKKENIFDLEQERENFLPHAKELHGVKPCSSLMSHSVSTHKTAVCKKARAPVGDRQCVHTNHTKRE